MGAIYIGVGHKDDAVVSKVFNLVVFFPNSRAKGLNEGNDFLRT